MNAEAEHALDHGFAKLRFSPRLEQQFINDLRTSRNAGTPATSLFIALFANMLLVSDWLMIPDVFSQAVTIRVMLITPIGLLLAVWSFNSVDMRVRERILWFIDTLMALAHAWLCLTSTSANAQSYLIVLALIVMYSASHLRTRFWVALKSISGILIIYCVALGLVKENNWAINISILMVLFSTSFFALYHLYALEYEARLNFLMTKRHKEMHEILVSTNARLQKVSRIDPLTQVSNRLYLEQYLKSTWERAKRQRKHIILMIFDVDYFKAYNDIFGHPKGDECLIAVSQAVSKSLRRPGDLIARYGGEEFVVVLKNTRIQDAEVAAQRVCDVVRKLNIAHPGSLVAEHVTVSVGLAMVRADQEGCTPDYLIAMADKALYRAKNEGRNRVCTHVPMEVK